MAVKNPTERELKELLYLFEEKRFDSPYAPLPSIEPIRLTNEELDELLALLGTPVNPNASDHVRKGITEAAEYFCQSLWLQENIPPSVAKRKLSNIRSAARKLLDAFEQEDESAPQARFYIQSFMRISAGKYGNDAMATIGNRTWNIPWNFWTAYRLPSAIQSVELLEHWAQMAIEMLEGEVGKGKTHQGKPAMRVLIQRLALAWLNTRGSLPGDGYDSVKGKAAGPFIRFASGFVELLRSKVTAAQRTYLPTLDGELKKAVSADAIRGHLRPFLKRAGKPARRK